MVMGCKLGVVRVGQDNAYSPSVVHAEVSIPAKNRPTRRARKTRVPDRNPPEV